MKHTVCLFKIEAEESGLGHSSFIKLTLRANFTEQNITMSIGENIGARKVIVSN